MDLKFEDKLMTALDREDIRIKIRNIVENDPSKFSSTPPVNNAINQEIIDLRRKIDDLMSENEALTEKYKVCVSDKESLVLENERQANDISAISIQNQEHLKNIETIQNREQQLRNTIQDFAKLFDPFNELIISYNEYLKVDEKLRYSIKKILNFDDPVSFLVFGCQISNIETLWNYLKSEIESLSNEDLKIMVSIIKFMIQKINMLYESPLYSLESIQIGSPFDSQMHIKTFNSSPYQGNIKNILLPGIRNLRTGKLICKSLVEY